MKIYELESTRKRLTKEIKQGRRSFTGAMKYLSTVQQPIGNILKLHFLIDIFNTEGLPVPRRGVMDIYRNYIKKDLNPPDLAEIRNETLGRIKILAV